MTLLLAFPTPRFFLQIKYLLLKSKENAVDSFITQFHQDCDKDHSVVKPWQQRVHITSAYVDMFGEMFGLEGIGAARGDRFLGEARKGIRQGTWGDCDDKVVFKMLCNHLSVEAFVLEIIADINNQVAFFFFFLDVRIEYFDCSRTKQSVLLIRSASSTGQKKS